MGRNSILFTDKKIKTSLSESGYAKIAALSQNDILKLSALYDDTKINTKEDNTYLYVSSRACDFDTSIHISNTIKDILQPYIETIAQNFDLYGGAFLSKPKLEKNEFSLHQDFTLIDKEKDTMYAIWIALQDTTISNGCMYIVGKSHTLFDNYISASYNNHKIHRKNIPPEYIYPIELKAGEGIIFGDDVFHGSFPNTSATERLAITARITSKNAQFVYYQKSNENTCIQYKIDSQDLIQYFEEFQKGIIPNHITAIKAINYKHSPITELSLQAALYRIDNGKNISAYKKIKYSIQSYCQKIFDSL